VFWSVLGSFDHPKPGADGLRTSLYLQVVAFGLLFGWTCPALFSLQLLCRWFVPSSQHLTGVRCCTSDLRLPSHDTHDR
jgi:hypothetical protein